jgi:hypothetical protein
VLFSAKGGLASETGAAILNRNGVQRYLFFHRPGSND